MFVGLTVVMFVVIWSVRLVICSPMFRRLFNGWNSHGRISKKGIDSLVDKCCNIAEVQIEQKVFGLK